MAESTEWQNQQNGRINKMAEWQNGRMVEWQRNILSPEKMFEKGKEK